jgi:hypothetical protein
VSPYLTAGQNLLAAVATDSAGGFHSFVLRIGPFGCAESPHPSHYAAPTTLLIKNAGDDRKDKLAWKWRRGALMPSELGDPTNATDYALCIYDGTQQLIASMKLPAGDVLWQPSSSGYQYTDPTFTNDGAKKAILKSGTPGKAKAIVKGAGINLPDPPPGPFALPVIVELSNGNVWIGGVFDSDNVVVNDATKFKAK